MPPTGRSYSVLIDAGHLKRQLGTRDRPASFEQIDAFLTAVDQAAPLHDLTLHRIYYYDARPFREKKRKPLNGGEVDFASTDVAIRGDELHARMCQRPFVAVRLGELMFRGWNLRNRALPNAADHVEISEGDLVPALMQKGVDMRIGLDIAALALKRIVDVVVLVTGDTDFVPAMKFARREGLQLFLVSLRDTPHKALVEHADLVLALGPRLPDIMGPITAPPAAAR